MASCTRSSRASPIFSFWANSHAADIWLVLSRAYPQFHVLQATGAGCDPSQEGTREFAPHCRRLLDYVRTGSSTRTEVDGVVVVARWRASYQPVLKDIERYRALGIAVLLFGPTFEYLADVPKILEKSRIASRSTAISKRD